MSHHSYEPSNKFNEMFKDIALGATGEFPRGKIDEKDEGEIKIGVTHTDNEVIINFGTQVVWFGMTAQQATELADTIRRHADQCEG